MPLLYCINNKPIPGASNSPEALSKIKEGETYEGEQRKVKGCSKTGWCIPSISERQGYALERFIPLPDATADDMQEEEEFIYELFSC